MSVEIYSKAHCPYCDHAKALLDNKGVAFVEYMVDESQEKLENMLRLAEGRRTVPQIFINGVGIGGFDDLRQLELSGELDKLLNNTN